MAWSNLSGIVGSWDILSLNKSALCRWVPAFHCFFSLDTSSYILGQVAPCHYVINRLPKNKEARSLNLTIRWKEIETTSNTKQLSIHFDRAGRSLTCLWCDFLSWWSICRVFIRFQCFQKSLSYFQVNGEKYNAFGFSHVLNALLRCSL